MCGICGGIGPKAPSWNSIMRQLQSMNHRGPDDRGIFRGNEISLGMCRLAIIDVYGGKQPSHDPDKLIQIVFNGEIYNFNQLRHNLTNSGINFKTKSEAEVLIQMYLIYGIEFVKYLNGMFAIALYDSRSHTLNLIRDRLGKKPLWYSMYHDSSLIFASEIKALMKVRQDLNFRIGTVSEVMQYGYVEPPNSPFEEIIQLEPATILTWHGRRIKLKKYWSPQFNSKIDMRKGDALERTKELVEEAVRIRLLSERPIGAFLSGGIDSSLVTANMVKLSSSQIQTFSIGFESEQFNEADYARQIADYLGTKHHEEIIKPDPTVIISEIGQWLDQPFADSSIIPTYLLAKMAKGNITVALGGDGGDEVFGGYDRYLATPILQALNPILGLVKLALPLFDRKVLGNRRKIDRASSQLKAKHSLAERYSSIHSLCQIEYLSKILDPGILDFSANERFLTKFHEEIDISKLDKMTRTDILSYLPGDILVKADLATMSNSLELRSPLLDDNVVAWGLSLPGNFKVNRFQTKYMLRELAKTLLPEKLIDRPKMGFAIPRAEWMRTGLKEMTIDLLTDKTARERGWFNHREVLILLKDHMRDQDKDVILWPILMLEVWARTWLDSSV